MNYRKFYKDYYNIDFDKTFQVHHLDFDRNNNDISNLLLLPKELHQRYHTYLQQLDLIDWKSGKLEISTRIDQRRFDMFTDDVLLEFLETVKECEQWLMYKQQLDFNKHM